MALQLYTYWRSSAAFRVRIALNLKGLDYRSLPKHLVKGEQNEADYHAINPQGLVPALVDDDFVVTQSLAICEYLEETHPAPPLLPGSARDRATVRGLALAIACDIHPLNNLSVVQHLRRQFDADDAAVKEWTVHWIERGFSALEKRIVAIAAASGVASGRLRYCYGSQVTLADVCLVPQVFNARRFDLDMTPFPNLAAIAQHLEGLPEFATARPNVQPDAPPDSN